MHFRSAGTTVLVGGRSATIQLLVGRNVCSIFTADSSVVDDRVADTAVESFAPLIELIHVSGAVLNCAHFNCQIGAETTNKVN
jgi:hypothetical protein